MFHNTTQNLQGQCARPRPIFWSQTGLVVRPTVSDHITDCGLKVGWVYLLIFNQARRLLIMVLKGQGTGAQGHHYDIEIVG